MNQDKERIIQILTESFADNKSTNFIVRQGKNKDKRLRKLIEYSLFYGNNFGRVFLSEKKNACTIILDTSKKKITLNSVIWDLRLIFQCIGIFRVRKVLKREALIKSNHPKEDFIHLWYIGVDLENQGRGYGSEQLKKIIETAKLSQKSIYLETSTERNFKFYENFGFKEVVTINELGYSLKMYCL